MKKFKNSTNANEMRNIALHYLKLLIYIILFVFYYTLINHPRIVQLVILQKRNPHNSLFQLSNLKEDLGSI